MSARDVLLIEVGDDGIALVTLNRPDALNAADEELHGAISTVWSDLSGQPGIRAVVLTGAGKAFSAGGDLPLLDRMTRDLDLRSRIMGEAATLVREMTRLPVPVVAAVNGPAVGLGCSLASLSDLVVMEEDAYFADPHVGLGLVAGDGGALTWPMNMGLQRAKEWLLLGGRMSSERALSYGLANRVVANGRSAEEARILAKRLSALPPQSLYETRRVLNQPLIARIDAALDDIIAAETKSFDEPAFRGNLARMMERNRG
ncbi:enoyl-CoA hydratase/isomerase family protein [Gordonia rhizosphera]|uniref:Putative enoyl-CoA hydratase n=1 Tax=Gordonia rhizosphera NBRC 16068 TaxID=1108045 RepID=K6V0Y5_9ACTN|nr:enoyl-CoA hydratase/isomerase family protein [Gordonia rhizosphera]GAB89568.1 putative enoyl-CoA hydratase [Gordonia rhizosphera NBRC 16068]